VVFIYNFHPTESYTGLRVPVPDAHDYALYCTTDAKQFGGPGLVQEDMIYPWQHVPMYGRNQSIQIYIPARSAQVLVPV
jgi:1,4-alpha-glucan branching enzyme